MRISVEIDIKELEQFVDGMGGTQQAMKKVESMIKNCNKYKDYKINIC